MRDLPNLPLLQERFYYKIKDKLKENEIKYPEFEVLGVFSQTWGSTALGFGGIGGQAITAAYTTVIESVDLGCAAVFFSEGLAYIVNKPNKEFYDDLDKRNMSAVRGHSKYEKNMEES